MKVKVRFPPSPTGIPHIGNTRTALFNYLFARHNNGEFFLRIEDTDRARLVPESERAIYEILEWLGLKWDGEVVRQSERLNIYKEYAQKLIEKDRMYEDNGALRFRIIKEGKTEWTDAIGEKHIVFENNTLEDFVAIKADGYPTYNFAHVIDDHLMEITHVIRGEEYISSNPKYIQLYKALDWELPVFAHLPVILGPDKTKLSKRHGAKSALDYRDEGYLKEALLNYMALLGWNPGEDREILTMEEMIGLFDLRDINLANPLFDAKKLLWMNGVYIRQALLDELKLKIKDQNAKLQFKIQNLDDDLLDKLIPLAQSRMTTLNDFFDLAEHFFVEPEPNTSDGKSSDIASMLIRPLENAEWNQDAIFAVLKESMAKFGVRMPVMYMLFTGKEKGLPLPESLVVLGKEKVLKRLKNYQILH